MGNAHRKYLQWSTALLVLSGYLALASVSIIGPAILALPLVTIALSPIAERIDARYAAYGIVTRAITIAYCCFLPLSLMNLGLMASVVTLAIYIQCYTLLHKKGVQNYYHLFLMSLFLLLAACVQSPEPVIGFVLLLFLVSAVWANIMLRVAVEEAALERPTHVDFVSLDYLKRHGREDAAWQGIPAMAALLSMGMVVMTALTFILMPRMEAGILGRNQTVVQTTGMSESVNLDSGGFISQDETPVMIVEFPGEENGQIQNLDWLYWRVTTLNTYEGNSWRSVESGLLDPGVRVLSNVRGDQRDLYRVERSVRPGRRLLHQVIYMDDVPRMGVPALDLVQRVQVDESTRGIELSWGMDRDFTVRLNKSGARRLHYEVWSEPGDPEPDELRGVPDDFASVSRRDFELFTDHALEARSVNLARQLVEGQPSLYDKVAAVEAYLSGADYLYTLNVPEVTTGSVIDSFINDTRRGHCELFATAMALMLRSQGIPTRVVRGFRGGEWNESDRTYTIRASMAHLWVEVWFPEFGWIVFDPSPEGDAQERSQIDRIAMLISRAVLKSKMFWFSEVVGFDRSAQIGRLRDFTVGLVGSFRANNDTEAIASGSGTRFGFIVPAVVLLLLVFSIAALVLRLRWVSLPRGLQLNRDQVQVVRLYLILRRRLMGFGVSGAAATAEELEAELRTPRWGAPREALEVLALYNAVRFGYRPLQGQQVAALRKAVSRLRPAAD